ncbi:hypothetical protein KIPB_006606 [Kipferlia bialata]|uniref:Uncharacterized protein n=1 Tax=Kipferlia bialata TaxID=797122 RepID=A0A9K3GIA5_9EUKA|nr:hypothetical protein KIPB_006606 [Kipferlia bialata]|eukprot:g6606.t1
MVTRPQATPPVGLSDVLQIGGTVLKGCVPAALLMGTTGGLGSVVGFIPVAVAINKQLERFGIHIPVEAMAEKLLDLIKEKGGDLVQRLAKLAGKKAEKWVKDKVKERRAKRKKEKGEKGEKDGSGTGEVDPDSAEGIRIRAHIEEALMPRLARMEEILLSLQQSHDDTHPTDIRPALEAWIAKERYGDTYTPEQLDQLQGMIDSAEDMTYHPEAAGECLSTLQSLRQGMATLLHGYTAGMCEMPLDVVRQITRCLLLEQCLTGKAEDRFDPDQHVPIQAFQEVSRELLSQARPRVSAHHPLLLVLANMGMGKTWSATQLALSCAAPDTETCVLPFLVVLSASLDTTLHTYFGHSGAHPVARRCQDLHRSGKTPLLVLDGLDEVINRADREGVVRWIVQFLKAVNGEALVYLSCRGSVWRESAAAAEKAGYLRNQMVGHPAADNTSACSLELCEYTDEELDTAIETYGLGVRVLSPMLRDLCRMPFMLRIIARRSEEVGVGCLPVPESIGTFMQLFCDKDMTSTRTVMHRMGITQTRSARFLTPLLNQLGTAAGSVDENALDPTWLRDGEWGAVASSGLLRIVYSNGARMVSINPVFQPYVQHYMDSKKMGIPANNKRSSATADTAPATLSCDFVWGDASLGYGTVALHQGVYTGDFRAGVPSGLGAMSYTNGDMYQGSWVDGKRDGDGEVLYFTERESSKEEETEYPSNLIEPAPVETVSESVISDREYKGHWRDDKRDGFGTMTYSDGGVYVGQWQKGERSGEGTMSFADGGVYRGGWRKDDTCGMGVLKMPAESGSVLDGEWSSGLSGCGVATQKNGSVYIGKWRNAKANGTGCYTAVDGSEHYGDWVDDKRHGYGTLIRPDGTVAYRGDWKDDCQSGTGTWTETDLTYEGDWAEGSMCGHGRLTTTEGVYVGQMENNKRHGVGTLTAPWGAEFKGQWVDGDLSGQGIITVWKGKRVFTYHGDVVDYMQTGQGTATYPDGSVYEGSWRDDKRHGHGRMTYASGMVWVGDWEMDKRMGWGVQTYKDGRQVEGVWLNDALANKGIRLAFKDMWAAL